MIDERLGGLLDFLADTLEPARQAEIHGLYVRALSGEPVSPDWVRFSPDGRWLVAADKGQGLLRWDLSDVAAEPAVLEAEVKATIFSRFAFSPDSRWLVTVGGGGLRLWDLNVLKSKRKRGVAR